MKACSYCGRESEPEILACPDCGTDFPLQEDPEPTASEIITPPEPVAATDKPWHASDAWKFLGAMLVLEFALYLLWRIPSLPRLLPGGARHFFIASADYALWISTMLYFAQRESFQSFIKAFNLANPPSSSMWFAIVFTLGLRCLVSVIIYGGFARGSGTISGVGFHRTFGLERYLYLAPALMAPFCEELVMRGFLYRAFRGSYSMATSMIWLVTITSVTHSDQYHVSIVAVVFLSTFNVFLCYLRERTNSLWDCILCHLVWNVTGTFHVFYF